MNKVSELIGKQLDFDSRVRTKNLGTPRPDMVIIQQTEGKKEISTENLRALCMIKQNGCVDAKRRMHFSAFLAFFLVVMTRGVTGVKDLKHFNEKVKKHSVSKKHLNNNEMDVALLCQVYIRLQLDTNLDNVMKEHLESARVYDAILAVCHDFIINEIHSADFLVIQEDETTDTATKMQVVLIFRYHVNGEIHERFWGFFQALSHTAEGISSLILNELSKLGIDRTPDKLICQTFDGASVMSGAQTGMQARIKERYTEANFVHCYAPQGNLIMQNATSNVTPVKIFFSNIQGICSFFSCSSNRTEVFDTIVMQRLHKAAPTRWNFQIHIVNTVSENKDALIECFQTIFETEKDQNIVMQASDFVRVLRDYDFLYWLNFFHEVMPHVDILFSQIQKRNIDPVQKDFAATVNTHSKVNKSMLRTELEVLYSRVNLHAAEGTAALLQLFLRNNMQETFHECVRLLSIIVTIPMSTVESERTWLYHELRQDDSPVSVGFANAIQTNLDNHYIGCNGSQDQTVPKCILGAVLIKPNEVTRLYPAYIIVCAFEDKWHTVVEESGFAALPNTEQH
ncbi:hypothetical protein ANN_15240 [Periplaneta americana]|uniref:DUF4371 domain-containing protein n=1 Tax=Periplaneta americana TaxID=6978 RepID=A0ABQ8SGA3_PERAM|nr:hypothetical protein ANN_15240 [Periplaneta americana]